MVLSVNPTYESHLDDEVKYPRITVGISFDFANTDVIYFTSHDDGVAPGGATVVYGVIGQGSISISQMLRDISSIGTSSITLIDKDKQITDIFGTKLIDATKGLRKHRLRIWRGFQGDAWSEYEIAATLQIDGRIDQSPGKYVIGTSDIQRIAYQKDLFNPKETFLTQTYTAGDTILNVEDTTEFLLVDHGTSYTDAPSSEVGYVRIKDNILRYTGKTATTFTGVVGGVLGSKDVTLEVDTTKRAENRLKVTEIIYIEMPVLKLIRTVLLGALYGQVGKSFPDHWTLGLDAEFVYAQDFLDYPNIWDSTDDTTGTIFRKIIDKKINGKKFIEKELLPLIGGWMPVYATGEWGFKIRADVYEDAVPIGTLSAKNVSKLSSLSYDMDSLKNIFEAKWNYSIVQEDTTRRKIYILSNSIAKHENSEVVELNFSGLHDSRHTRNTIRNIVQINANKYANPPFRISAEALPSQELYEVGDVIRLHAGEFGGYAAALKGDSTLSTSKEYLKDFTRRTAQYNGYGYYTGVDPVLTTPTLSRPFEIIGKQMDLVTGKCSYTLEGSSGTPQLVEETGSGNAISDFWYISQGGTNITGLTGYSAGHLTSAVTLTGGDTLSAGIYYHAGDLTFDVGVTFNITKNVIILCSGTVTINGTLDGKGQGHAGIIGTTSIRISADLTPTGYLGRSIGGGGVYRTGSSQNYTSKPGLNMYPASTIVTSGHSMVPFNDVDVDNSGNCNILTRYGAKDFQGVPGAPGQPFIHDTSQFEIGADGGNSGASLTIVCRGLSFGASGKIDLSGNDGNVGTKMAAFRAGTSLYSGSGDGGQPGALRVIYDGLGAIKADINESTFIANSGSSIDPAGTNPFPVKNPLVFEYYYSNDAWTSFYHARVDSGISYTQSMHAVNLLAPYIAPEQEDNDLKPAAATGLTVAGGTTELLKKEDGTIQARAKLTWTATTDQKVDYYEVYYKKTADTLWIKQENEPSRSDSESWINIDEPGQWDFRLVAINIWGNPSDPLEALNQTIQGKTQAPTNVTDFTVTGVIGGYQIDVTAAQMPTDVDLASIIITSSTTNSRTTPTPDFVKSYGVTPSKAFNLFIPGTTGQLRYFWIQTIDTTGNLSTSYYPATDTSTKSATPTTGTLATKGSVDLATSEVTNKTADNITYTSTGTPTVDSLNPTEVLYNGERGFRETFENTNSLGYWTNYSGLGEISRVQPADPVTGGWIARIGDNSGNDQIWWIHQKNIPFDPTKIYKHVIRIRKTAGSGFAYVGLAGIASDGSTLVNTNGLASFSGQHYHCIDGIVVGSSWTEYVGYTKGHGATVGTAVTGTESSPGEMHPDVVYIRPLILVNYNSVAGTTEIDSYIIELGADNTVNRIEQGIETDAAVIQNVNHASTPKLIWTFNSGNPYWAIGSDTWHPSSSSPQIVAQYNSGNPRFLVGDYFNGKYIEYDHSNASLNVEGVDVHAGNIGAANFLTSGSTLTAGISSGATTMTVVNATDFPSSGDGIVLSYGSTTATDTFSWTAKSGNQLTGVTGVTSTLAAGSIVLFESAVVIRSDTDKVQVWRKSGVNYIADFDTNSFITASTEQYAMNIKGGTVAAIYGQGYDSSGTDHIGVYGTGYRGGKFASNTMPVVIQPSALASAPTHTADKGTLWVTSGGLLYINTDGSTNWAKVGAQ